MSSTRGTLFSCAIWVAHLPTCDQTPRILEDLKQHHHMLEGTRYQQSEHPRCAFFVLILVKQMYVSSIPAFVVWWPSFFRLDHQIWKLSPGPGATPWQRLMFRKSFQNSDTVYMTLLSSWGYYSRVIKHARKFTNLVRLFFPLKIATPIFDQTGG